MAVVFIVSREDNPHVKQEYPIKEKLVVGKSVYCDVKLDDKLVSSIQCEIKTTKSGHVVVTNMDLKREVLLNHGRLKKAPIKTDDILKIGPFVMTIDRSKLTEEEINILNSEYVEYI